MNHGSSRLGTALGLLALALSLSLAACGSTGQAHGELVIPVPFSDDVHVEFFVSTTGERTFDVNAGPSHGGKCFKITWYDENGNELGTTEGSTDQNGFVSGAVPDGATHFEGELVRCSDPDAEKSASGAKLLQPPMDGGVTTRRTGPSPSFAAASDLQSVLVFGGPLVPGDDPGDDNLTYGFHVVALDASQAHALLDPILQGGIGTPVPPNVEVLRWTTMEASTTGVRLRTAQPGQYELWSFVFNDGTFSADLLTGSTRHSIGGWDVVEVDVPLGAFEYGLTPGVTYANHAVLTHRTDLMSATKSMHDGFEYTD